MRMCNRYSCLSEKSRLLRDENLSDIRLPIRQFLPNRHRFTYSLVPAISLRIPHTRRKTASPNCQGEFLRKRKPSHTKIRHFSTKELLEKKTLEKAVSPYVVLIIANENRLSSVEPKDAKTPKVRGFQARKSCLFFS